MRTLAPAHIALTYDGSIEGFFSAVFYAFAIATVPEQFTGGTCLQPAFGQEIIDVPTNLAHAERVRVGLARAGGHKLYRKVEYAFLSCEPGRELALLRYVDYAMRVGYRVHSDLSHECVQTVESLATRVENECEKARQFMRFEELENGVFFARYAPKANVVPLVMVYFAARYNVHPFMIYDETHKLAGVYDMQRTYFVHTDELNIPARAEPEATYQQLWKTFYDSVSNSLRHNPELRRNLMPKRYWVNLTEMQLAVQSAGS